VNGGRSIVISVLGLLLATITYPLYIVAIIVIAFSNLPPGLLVLAFSSRSVLAGGVLALLGALVWSGVLSRVARSDTIN
jgi:hypothetical protein